MDKKEFKLRLKEIGYDYGKFCSEHGVEIRTIYSWKEVPKWAEYWVRMVIAEKKITFDDVIAREAEREDLLRRIRGILDE